METRFYCASPKHIVVLDMVSTARQGESTAFFHYIDGEGTTGAHPAKVKRNRRGEAYFVANRKKIFFNAMQPM